MTANDFNFDQRIERRGTDSGKWGVFDPDVIPMWVADMDFRSPQPVIEALHQRVEHGVFGYGYGSLTRPPQDLIAVLQARYASRYEIDLVPDDLLFVPNVVSAIYGMAKIIGDPDANILIQTPNYWPFFKAAEAVPRPVVTAPLVASHSNGTMRYELDFDAFEAAITPQTRLFIFGNPHNPVGRVYERWELERMAEICLRHNLIICSDEIHGDLVYEGQQHIPIMSLSPEVAERCMILTGASKAFNLPGFKLGIAISKNHDLLAQVGDYFSKIGLGTYPLMGYVVAQAAFQHGQPWLDALLTYLQSNRDYALDFIQGHLPGITPTCPEATYLMLLDCQQAGIEGDPSEWFLNRGRVALSGNFGSQGFDQFARLNFGCPRSQLAEALERMRQALQTDVGDDTAND